MPDDSAFFDRVRLEGDPVAAPEAQVRSGSARVTVLASRLLRLEWTPDGAFDDRGTYAFPNRRAPVPAFEVLEEAGATVVQTEHLRLRHVPDGAAFSAANLSIELLGPPRARWTPGTVDRWNLGGARRTVDGARGPARLEPGLVSRSGWALVDDGDGFRFSDDGWVAARPPADGRQDWYFFGYGHRYADAVSEYVRGFGGRPPLPPRWALGPWWSRYWAYHDHELRSLVQEFRDRGFPLDVLVIDMDWHTPQAWTGYTWNRELFPDPPGFLDWLHRHHLHTTLNLHPALGVAPFESDYPAMAQAMGVEAGGDTIPFRITDRRFAQAYFEVLHHPKEDQGVDFWWMDWQQGRTSELPGLDPLPWLNHLHHRDLRRRPGTRPLLLSRWGGLGSHRYPVGFSGDTFAGWEALRFQPRYTAAGANVGYGWWSHDIGGHFGAGEPELYARWVQFGAFSPLLRLHSSNHAEWDRRPWAFGPEVEGVARDAFRARLELMPYLYTCARHTSETGVAMIRPMAWVAPEHDSAYVARDQYLLGEDLLVAPVLEPADGATGLARKDVWLPPGEWIERASGETVVGPRWVTRQVDLACVPQYVRAGAIIPLADPALSTSEQTPGHLILSAFPGASGSTRVYHDDGTTSAHLAGDYGWTAARLEAPDPSRCSVEVEPAPQLRRLTLRLEHTNRPREVRLGGARLDGWTYEAGAGRTIVEVPDLRGPVKVEVLAEGSLSRRGPTWNRTLETARPEPLVHIVEHRTPDDAQGTLGWVVVAPGQGSRANVSLTWTLERGHEHETFSDATSLTGSDRAFAAPFRWDGSPSPLRWTVDVAVAWEGGEVRQRHRSAVLQPSPPQWRVAVAPGAGAQQREPAAVVRDAESPRGGLAWQTRRWDPSDPDFGELGEPFVLRLARSFRPAADDVGETAWAVAAFTLPSPRAVAFAYSSSGAADVWCGSQLDPDIAGAGPTSLIDSRPRRRRTSSVTLGAGRHQVVFTCRRPKDLHPGWWFLSASIVHPESGEVQVDALPSASGPTT